MKKSELLRALQQEIRRHDFNYFVDQPPSVAQGGKGVVVPGCPACMKRINTMNQFLDHLASDAIPALLDSDVLKLLPAEMEVRYSRANHLLSTLKRDVSDSHNLPRR